MKKTTSLIAAALLLATACAPETDPAQQFRDAMPSKQSVQIGTPSADAQPGALSVRRDALGQSPLYGSEYAWTSYWTAVTVNVGVWWTLTLVEVITAFPPSHCEEDVACTWGPWLGDDGLNEWLFQAEKVGDAYEYALSARPLQGAATWNDLLVGTARPGVDRDHGDGTFTIDFDAQDLLAHPETWVKEDFGAVTVAYDNRTDVSIQATLVGGRNDDPEDPHAMDATYSFLDTGAGGELQLGVVNTDTTERVSLRTRWDATGAGRGDARYNPGAGDDLLASECWAGAAGEPPWVPAWGEIYDSKVPFGDEADCAFSPASYLPLPL
jgi:hypothetical protein